MFSYRSDLRGSAPALLGRDLSLLDLEDVARRGRAVSLDDAARVQVRAARAAIAAIADGGDEAPRVYGVNTGFGFLAETRISALHVRELQQNLVRSHACGVGADLGVAEVRAMMLLRAQVLSLGHSGVREEVIDMLAAMLNRGVHPRIPSQGSVGASGDLAPLAHLALVLTGEGEARVEQGPLLDGGEALRQVGLAPLVLEAKEGLALINGTQLMAALGSLAVLEASRLCVVADIAGSMSLEANKGTARPFDERVISVRPHPGAARAAANLRRLLQDSAIMRSHADCGRVQDAYSFRCMPQVHGASRDALVWAAEVLAREINSVTDNPLVFLDEQGHAELISGGNFHGQPLAIALDLAAIAVAELANISERRVEQLVNPALSSGLTPFLARDSGLQSGFMIAQVASASLVSENKVLCHPASVDSIPSSAGKEDHVSMGSISARKLLQVVENVRRALAIEVLTAAAGVDQRAPLIPAIGVRAALAVVREKVPPFHDDRPLYRDIAAVDELLISGALLERCSAAVGGALS
jgi:histidine ammonia-lyase